MVSSDILNRIGLWRRRIRDGLYPRVIRTECGGHSAVFEVDNQTEEWRASELGGEADVLAEFLERIDPGDVVWDVGANIGVYTIFAGRRGADVVAFEPDSEFRSHLRENVRLNNLSEQVDIVSAGLSQKEGSVTLHTDGTDGTSPSLVATADRRRETVKVVRGDDTDLPPPDVLKMDIEGAEADALSGMKHHLETVRFALVEVHPEFLPRFGGTEEEVYDILESVGLAPAIGRMREEQNLVFFDR